MIEAEVPVVVEEGRCPVCDVPTRLVHHRSFPEIRAECGSVPEGAALLARRLRSYREGAQNSWTRELVERAIADVVAFLGTSIEGPEGSGACRCRARIPGSTTQPLPTRMPPPR